VHIFLQREENGHQCIVLHGYRGPFTPDAVPYVARCRINAPHLVWTNLKSTCKGGNDPSFIHRSRTRGPSSG